MKIEIKNRFTMKIIFECESESGSLHRADLSGADLSEADLSEADLSGANLSVANLSGADLFFAQPSDATSNYTILSTPTHIKIDCQFHEISEWMEFPDKRIIEMDGTRALKFWRLWKPILRSIAIDRGWIN